MALDHIFSVAEAQIQEAADALLSTRPLDLERCSSLLREAAAGIARTLEQQGARSLAPAVALRVRALSERLALVREQLARVSAFNERQTASILPPMDTPTYGGTRHNTKARIYYATT